MIRAMIRGNVMQMARFTVYGEPVGKARPRFNTRTKTAYTPSKTAEYEREVATAYKAVSKGKMFNGAVALDIKAYFAIPKSTSKKRVEQILKQDIRPTKKPDIDNIAKIIIDGLNGIAYEDDKQVVSVRVNKYYSAEPRVEAVIEECQNEKEVHQ